MEIGSLIFYYLCGIKEYAAFLPHITKPQQVIVTEHHGYYKL